MNVIVYRLLGEIDPETDLEPIIYLCAKCQDRLYNEDELEEIAEMTSGSCDECGDDFGG